MRKLIRQGELRPKLRAPRREHFFSPRSGALQHFVKRQHNALPFRVDALATGVPRGAKLGEVFVEAGFELRAASGGDLIHLRCLLGEVRLDGREPAAFEFLVPGVDPAGFFVEAICRRVTRPAGFGLDLLPFRIARLRRAGVREPDAFGFRQRARFGLLRAGVGKLAGGIQRRGRGERVGRRQALAEPVENENPGQTRAQNGPDVHGHGLEIKPAQLGHKCNPREQHRRDTDPDGQKTKHHRQDGRTATPERVIGVVALHAELFDELVLVGRQVQFRRGGRLGDELRERAIACQRGASAGVELLQCGAFVGELGGESLVVNFVLLRVRFPHAVGFQEIPLDGKRAPAFRGLDVREFAFAGTVERLRDAGFAAGEG